MRGENGDAVAGSVRDIEIGPDEWKVEAIAASALARRFSKDAPTERGIRDEITRYAAEVAGPDPSPIVKSLSRAAAMLWWGMRMFEANLDMVARAGPLDWDTSVYEQRRIGRLHRRWMSTLRTLQQVRTLEARERAAGPRPAKITARVRDAESRAIDDRLP